jgi:lipid A ethanolaminephosphotransferase
MTNYFMNTYHVVIDDTMLRNTLQTDLHESMDLLSVKQVLYFVFLGLLPAYFIYQAPVQYGTFKQELWRKLKVIFLSLVIIASSLFLFSKYYTSFFREHKPLRFTANPIYWMYSTGKYINLTYNSGPTVVKPMGLDAVIGDNNKTKKLVIMVVGEAARADHFSLNGYERETNPKLKKEEIINFPHVYSCGTSTAVSVPCMFSLLNRDSYSYKKGRAQENVIDVLKHTKKVALLWRDNNSDSKGVALRIPHEDYRIPKNNTICVEGECRDIGMLVGLDDFIAKQQGKDILIVLHQMGNHGPAYYKRYTKAYEKFTPVCRTNQLEACSQEEIANAYDNAILYTDNFLSKVIGFLKKYDNRYQTAMLYMADHGESLGENGLYLHGLPYFMAPDAQKHIGALLWLGEKSKKTLDASHLKNISNQTFSQDNLADSLLGLLDVKTEVYHPNMDIFHED